MHKVTATLLLASSLVSATVIEKRACPNVHIFGARETTAPAGYGTAGTVVNLVLQAYSGSTAEAINYPACGGQSSCGGVSYGNSVVAGIKAVASAVNAFYSQCPSTQLVIVGYSQGGQIFDDAFCGGGDTNEGYPDTSIPIVAGAVANIKAAIFMGDPRYISGLSYNVGTCTAHGFAPRPAGFSCPSASKVKSYCDAADPYCCTGSDANTHQQYGNKYGQAALTFIKAQLSGGSTPTGGQTTAPPTTTSNPGGGGCTQAKYGQCGGQTWTGCTVCASGSTCKYSNAYYSQCL